MSDEKRFGIQYGNLSEEIHVGLLNKAGNMFVGTKQAVTDECIGAVAQLVEDKHDGAVTFIHPETGDEIDVIIRKKGGPND